MINESELKIDCRSRIKPKNSFERERLRRCRLFGPHHPPQLVRTIYSRECLRGLCRRFTDDHNAYQFPPHARESFHLHTTMHFTLRLIVFTSLAMQVISHLTPRSFCLSDVHFFPNLISWPICTMVTSLRNISFYLSTLPVASSANFPTVATLSVCDTCSQGWASGGFLPPPSSIVQINRMVEALSY